MVYEIPEWIYTPAVFPMIIIAWVVVILYFIYYILVKKI